MSIKVEDLIEQLQKFDGKAEVLLPRGLGWDDIYGVEKIDNVVSLNDPENPREFVALI